MRGAPSPLRQTAVLSLVFGAVVVTGAVTGAWTGSGAPPVRHSLQLSADADRWSGSYSAQQYAGLRQTLSGSYVGVGLWVVRQSDGSVAVSRVQPDTPAAQAGIQSGERLLRVDGRDVSGLPVTEVVALLRGGAPGDVGSPVALTLADGAALRQLTVRRRLVAADDVTVDRPATGVTRIAVQEFSSGSGDEVLAAVHQAAAEQPGGGLLLDLRGCAGGLLAEAVEAASAFLDGGPVGALRTADGILPLTAESGGNSTAPLVVEVDGGTMSAAELLAGALQDRGRAVLVGSATFGKGTVQAPTPLAGGGVEERTVAEYTTPSGRSPEGAGIQPDVAVPLSASPSTAQRTALAVLRGLQAEDAAGARQVSQ